MPPDAPDAVAELQRDFAAALLAGADAPPPAAIAGDAAHARRRFAIHRATVMQSLADALGHAFPVVRAIATEENFRFVARAYVRARPPLRPVLAEYGAGFAEFLAGVGPAVADLPFLPDLARLEWALHESYFAADAPALDAAALATVAPTDTPRLRLRLHGAARHVASDRHPIHAIWSAGAMPQPMPEGGEAVLATRPGHQVQVVALTPGDHALLGEIAMGAPLEEAAGAALAAEPGFDFAAALAAHLVRGTFAALNQEPPP
jgi:hypothetical protein